MRVQRSKLMYRVVFPFELKLGCAAAEGCDAADTPYSLFAVIVHVGSGLDHGALFRFRCRISALGSGSGSGLELWSSCTSAAASNHGAGCQ